MDDETRITKLEISQQKKTQKTQKKINKKNERKMKNLAETYIIHNSLTHTHTTN